MCSDVLFSLVDNELIILEVLIGVFFIRLKNVTFFVNVFL